jgi:hypothetical protein
VAWRLLEEFGVTPENHEIARDIVYTFQARIAERWREGRVFISGDAAHTMPPFAGQGLLSSMRDSTNLAWKLDLVLRGVCGEDLLDTYQLERRPHVRAWTELSLFEGRVSCELDPERAAQRDRQMMSGGPPPHFEQPILTEGLLARDQDGLPLPPAGTLSLQARVAAGGREALFDDIFGGARFSLVTHGGDARSVLGAEQLALLERLDASIVAIVSVDDGEAGEAGEWTATDIDGRYAAYFEEHGIAAFLARPDFYVFGAVAELSSLGDLVDDLAAQLRLGSAVATAGQRR